MNISKKTVDKIVGEMIDDDIIETKKRIQIVEILNYF